MSRMGSRGLDQLGPVHGNVMPALRHSKINPRYRGKMGTALKVRQLISAQQSDGRRQPSLPKLNLPPMVED